MRTLRLASVAVTAAVLVSGLTACGSDGKAGTKAAGDAAPGKALELDPKAALAASALVMQKFGNGSVELVLPEDTMAGAAQWKQGTDLDLTGRGKATTKVRVLGDDVYLGSAEKTAGAGGKHWAKVGPKDKLIGPMAGMFLTTAQVTNPVLQLTVAAQTGSPAKVGPETVGGAQTTHYHAVEDAAKITEALAALGADQRAAVQQTLAVSGNTLTVDFWINAKQELVQLREYGDKAGEKQAVTVTYSGLGSAPRIEAPAAAEVGSGADFSKILGG
ncbi:hypothetical protein ACFVHB_00705 [Kitasatospora sp. NPDC127111]|uniref:hypothetical protein n=1 Tax=Kitasatospora sp. NPDC127111 TaxID=3345363 RepID=UPI00362CBF51